MKNILRLLLVLGLAGALQLAHWAKSNDPRFYKFLESPVGTRISKIFGWQAKKSVKIHYPSTSLLEYGRWTLHSESEDQDFTPITQVLDNLWSDLDNVFGQLIDESTKLNTPKLKLVLFKSRDHFLSFLQKYQLVNHAPLGYFDPHNLALFMVDPRDPTANDEQSFESFTTLKHEIAHAYFYTGKIHSLSNTEGNWLVEGLAAYAEGESVGAQHPSKIRFLKGESAHLFPLTKLIEHRNPEGFMEIGDEKLVEVAYCQSWALVSFLMSKYQDKLLTYIKMAMNPELAGYFAQKTRKEIFEKTFGMPLHEIELEFLEYINSR